MRIQIYTAQTPEEALAVAAAGADHVGVTPSRAGLPGQIDDTAARAICDALHGVATSVALTVANDPGEIGAMVDRVRPDILHLCPPPGTFQPHDVKEMRAGIAVPIMQAIAVDGPGALDVARQFAAVADFLILDSYAPDVGGVGAAGFTHDWGISAAIVAAVDVPVILAGGLSPENVAAAIARVQPWGVDSLTHTNRSLPGGGFVKDVDRVKAFVAAARRAVTP